MTDVRVQAPPRPAPSGTPDWRDHAACRDSDPELFFPLGTAGPALLQQERAKQVCAGCQVRTPCLEWALASGQEAGVWGGASEDERRALRRRRQVARPGWPCASSADPGPGGPLSSPDSCWPYGPGEMSLLWGRAAGTSSANGG